ncbi:MAG: DUF4234 domain-containing protein [Actinobacteria bacterium]|nr:DUF4234 domain-containing protein [Actinomycetota bacterium]
MESTTVAPVAPVTLAAPTAPATVQSATRLEAAVRERADTDRTFLNWWIYIFIVSWVTLGLASLYYYIRRISRIDAFSRRKVAYYEALIEYTERRAAAQGAETAVRPLTDQLRADLDVARRTSLKPIRAGLTVLLSFITLGIWYLVALHQLNRAWDDRQRFEATFDDKLSQAWIQLGLLSYPITFKVDQGKARNFWIWLVLTVVTLGIWAAVWDYRLHTDPDRLYPEFHAVEDSVLQVVRTS